MTGLDAFWGGFSSFFSVWQVCIFQISPFFMALIVGLYLTNLSQTSVPNVRDSALIPCSTYIVGFSLLYSLLIASGLGLGRALVTNIGNLRLISGVVILFISFFIILANRLPYLREKTGPLLPASLALMTGLTFAAIYSPCITPTMSAIMGMATRPETAFGGWVLALLYGLGLSLAFAVTGIALISLVRKLDPTAGNAVLLKDICGAVLLVPALLNITGLMVYYKAFFLGLLV
jgi:cytochrome c-type biogenesis protein